MPPDEASSELHSIVVGLRVYVERLTVSGAVGLPPASPELMRERTAVAPIDVVSAPEPAAPPREVTVIAAPVATAPAPVAPPGAPAPADAAERKQRLRVLASQVAGCTR